MPRNLTLRQTYDRFKDHWTFRVTSETLQKIEYDLRRWEKHSGNPVITKIDTDALQKFLKTALAAGHGEETVEGSIRTVRAILHQAEERGLLKFTPRKPRRVRDEPRRPKPPSLEKFNEFLLLGIRMDDSGKLPLRRWPGWFVTFFSVAYFTAMRRGDLLRLKWDQVTRESIAFRAGKTSKLQTVPMHPTCWRIVEEFREWRTNDKLFNFGGKVVYKATTIINRVAGTKCFFAQNVRKVSARAYERARPGAGALILGHSLPGATACYLDVPEMLADAVKKLEVPEAFLTVSHRQPTLQVAASPNEAVARLFGVVTTSTGTPSQSGK